MKKILLIGNPNVGKSVLFSRLTGVHVFASNYPGTTVEYTKGEMLLAKEKAQVIDVPGIYSLENHSKADEVALEMLEGGDYIINVVDATNLERSLNLTLQLLETGKPLVVVLNMWDETSHRGITIDIQKLEEILGVPVIATIAVTGQGIKEAVTALSQAKPKLKSTGTDKSRWKQIGQIISLVQELKPHRHTFLQRLEDFAVKPFGSMFIGLLVMVFSFLIIRTIGEGLINHLFDPLFEKGLSPLLLKLSLVLQNQHFLHNILIGKIIDGSIDYTQSFGVLTTGLYVPIAAVLPYIIAFYLVLGALEDIGYLPRFAILLDHLMHHMGLHGYAVIPHLLGLGCNVPGILATRSLESKRERFIAITLISIAVPCAALQAMIIGVLGKFGLIYIFLVYLIIFCTWLITGILLNKLIKGFSPEMLLDVPPLRIPRPKPFLKKFWIRTKGFLKEALPVVLIGVLIINIIYYLGLFSGIAKATSPVIEKLWGLPPNAVFAIIIGFLRKDVAVGMLTGLNLSLKQLIIGCSVLAMTFPCIASFVMIFKELGLRLLLLSTLIMLIITITVGSLLNIILKFFI
ncbi:MAG: ferrous iron transporter B [Pseudomonadota bacterium]